MVLSRFKMVDGKIIEMTEPEYQATIIAQQNTAAPKLTTYKSDLWRRCTPAEAEMLDGALADAPAPLRRLFDAITMIEHDAPEYSTLRDSIAATVGGYDRADELLAPSVG